MWKYLRGESSELSCLSPKISPKGIYTINPTAISFDPYLEMYIKNWCPRLAIKHCHQTMHLLERFYLPHQPYSLFQAWIQSSDIRSNIFQRCSRVCHSANNILSPSPIPSLCSLYGDHNNNNKYIFFNILLRDLVSCVFLHNAMMHHLLPFFNWSD